MRYAQRGGYTPAGQQRRERLRLEAGGRFARGGGVSEIARDLRVTEGSVCRWRRSWREGGAEALKSRGPVSRERLSPQQFARLEAELRKGPLAHGFAGGPALDAGPDQDADRQAVPRRLHRRGGVEADAPAWLVGPGSRPPGNRAR